MLRYIVLIHLYYRLREMYYVRQPLLNTQLCILDRIGNHNDNHLRYSKNTDDERTPWELMMKFGDLQ